MKLKICNDGKCCRTCMSMLFFSPPSFLSFLRPSCQQKVISPNQNDVLISFLPLAHMFERLIEVHVSNQPTVNYGWLGMCVWVCTWVCAMMDCFICRLKTVNCSQKESMWTINSMRLQGHRIFYRASCNLNTDTEL